MSTSFSGPEKKINFNQMNLFRQTPPAVLLFCLLLSACLVPSRHFESYTAPAAPDYALEKNWAALPGKKDSADFVVPNSGLKDGQADAKVDVFFVHPTLYFRGKGWNADVADVRTNNLVDQTTIQKQASVFNGSCRIYAPRYRQATLYSFVDGKTSGRKALDLAYTDVKRAFEYYLKHYNNGRPIIIAGHSQGTYHASRLINDFFENDPVLYQKLVAAYLIGGNITQQEFKVVVPCGNAGQTGCLVAWRTMRWGSKEKVPRKKNRNAPVFDAYGRAECVNPLTWKTDTVYAPASLNKGSVPKKFNEVQPGVIDAKISPEHILWIHKPKKRGYPKVKNCHIYDYSLFYMNIRENVRHRIGIYFGK
jgi:hypothetical protein